jgi:hypothetical protein
VDVPADGRDVSVVGEADDVVDALEGGVEARRPLDVARVVLAVDPDRLAREQDLGLVDARDANEPVGLLAVDVARDAGVDADEQPPSDVDGEVRPRLRRSRVSAALQGGRALR